MNRGIGSLIIVLAMASHGCANDSSVPSGVVTGPARSMEGAGRHTVVVNADANGNGTARTVQQGLDMVAAGGTVLVAPGTYDERIVIAKGVTLTSIGGGSGQVILRGQSEGTAAPATDAVITVGTAAPVILRDFSIVHDNIRGVNILRDADVLVEQVTFAGVSTTTPVVGNGVTAHYNAGTTGKRARVIVRDSRFSVGGIPVSFGGDVDGLIERNEMRQAVGRLICVNVSTVGQGGTMLLTPGSETNVDIVGNLFEDCGANLVGRFGSVNVLGSPGATTRGTVNVVGNTIRNTSPTGCIGTAIQYEHYAGVIEHNTIVDVIQPCAPAMTTRGARSAIFVGSRIAGIQAANVAVRFNDIGGNEYAGLRIGANQAMPIDASCNWWGRATGPSSVGSAEGLDAIVIQPGGAVPTFTPFATAPVAGSAATTCP
jgi:hypothetical protein